MPIWTLKYAGPLLLALVLHLVIFFFVNRNWSQSNESSSLVEFKAINAQLLVLKPKLVVKQKPEIKKNPPPSQLERIQRPDSKSEKPVEPVQEKDRLDKTDHHEDEQLARRELLDQLSRSNWEATMNQEVLELENATNEQIAVSYQAKIYEQVRKKWRRPPSARNGMQAKLLVELIPTGEVVSVTVVESSGLVAFDRSAEQAVMRSGRFEVPDESRLFEEYFRKFFFLFRPEDLLR